MPRRTSRTERSDGSILPLQVRGLVYETGGRRLIEDLDLTVTAGTITVVMGPNGAGKSVLLRLVHGLLRPTRGEIRWGAADSVRSARRRQALVFQRPVLLRRSVADNLRFVLKLNGGDGDFRCLELLRHVGLEPNAHQPARQLSGGEQQRLAMARALALAPEVWLLDEPTANLDPASVAAIENLIRQAHANGTKIILVTHDGAQARRLADEVLFLHRGRVLEHTDAGRFFARPSTREAEGYLAGRLIF